jgi:hypothetical protein
LIIILIISEEINVTQQYEKVSEPRVMSDGSGMWKLSHINEELNVILQIGAVEGKMLHILAPKMPMIACVKL